MSERWRSIPGYEGSYDVSDLGRVRSWIPWRGVALPRLMSPTAHPDGYRRIILYDQSGGRKGFKVYALVARAFLGEKPSGLVTRHLDGVRSNDQLSNLRYGTPEENTLDSVQHGSHFYASKTHCPKGHEYTPENTQVFQQTSRSGRRVKGRHCRTCLREKEKRRPPRRRRRSKKVAP